MSLKAIKISETLVHKALLRAKAMRRSTAGQIEFWANIGQIAEDNPDLSFTFIRDILIAKEEADANQLEEYIFGEGKNHARQTNKTLRTPKEKTTRKSNRRSRSRH